MKVIHDFFVPDVVIEPAKSVFEFPGGLWNLIQVHDSLAETHGGKGLGGVERSPASGGHLLYQAILTGTHHSLQRTLGSVPYRVRGSARG